MNNPLTPGPFDLADPSQDPSQDPMALPVSVGMPPPAPEQAPPPPANPLDSLRQVYEAKFKSPTDALAQGITSAAGAAAPAVKAAGQAAEAVGNSMTPEQQRQAMERDQLEHLQGAADTSVQAERDQAALEKQAAVAKGAEMDRHARAVAQANEEQQRVIGAETAKYRSIVDQARNTKIDENQLFNEAGFGGKLALIGSVALGGLLAPNNGGQNMAVEIINKRIARNIDAQKANLDNLNQAASNQRTVLGDLRQQFGDTLAAENATHGIALDQVANDLEIQMSGVKDQRAVARLQELVAQIRDKAIEYHQAAEDRAAAKTQQQFQNKMAQAQLAESVAARKQQASENEKNRAASLAETLLRLRPTPVDPVEAKKNEAEAAKAAAEASAASRSYKGVVGGQGDDHTRIPVSNAQDAQDLDGKVGGAETVIDSIADVRNLLKGGRTTLLDKDKSIGRAAMADVVQFLAQDEKGVPSDADVKRTWDRAGGTALQDPTAFFAVLKPEERDKVLSYVQDKVSRRADKAVKARLGQQAAFSYKGHSVVDQGDDPTERAPAAKLDAARSASTARVYTTGERTGEFQPTASPAEQAYSTIGKTSNFKSSDEAIATADALNQDIVKTQKAIQAARTPEEKAQAQALHNQVLLSRYLVLQEANRLKEQEGVKAFNEKGISGVQEYLKQPHRVILK